MTIEALIAGSGLPTHEAELLLAAALQRERTWVIAHVKKDLSVDEAKRAQTLLDRRKCSEPVEYITGQKEFFGRMFAVSPAVLIPRPATEQLIVETVRFLTHPHDSSREVDAGIAVVARVLRALPAPRLIADIGTGSGCIAVTLALECPDCSLIATDVSEDALDVARKNASIHHVQERMRFLHGPFLEPLSAIQEPFIVVSNPPYVPDGASLPRDVKNYEPSQALFGGADGGDVLRQIVVQATSHPFCAGILLECQTDQITIIGLEKPR